MTANDLQRMKDLAAQLALEHLDTCYQELEHAEQALRDAGLAGHALGIQWARRKVAVQQMDLRLLRQAFRDEAHR